MWLFVDFLFALELLGGDRHCKNCVIAHKYVQVGAIVTSEESSWNNIQVVGSSSCFMTGSGYTNLASDWLRVITRPGYWPLIGYTIQVFSAKCNDFLSLQGMKKICVLCLF